MSSNQRISLSSGILDLHIRKEAIPWQQVLGFASRRSRKRGFVFVSKVLGKHYPVRPSRMQQIHQQLAKQLTGLAHPIVMIAMAETATALGQGVYEEYCRSFGADETVFLHSTRYRLDHQQVLEFAESHSHATRHLLYEPQEPESRELFHRAKSLVLIDDEISTGRTLCNLAGAFRKEHSELEQVRFVSITDWLTSDRRNALQSDIVASLEFANLIQGEFAFTESDTFDPGDIPNVIGKDECKDRYLQTNYGRLGYRGTLQMPPSIPEQTSLKLGSSVLVLGTGEFAFPPYHLALALEEMGHQVTYQSTTRSPLLVEHDLSCVVEFTDNYHDDMPNYLYNVSPDQYDSVLIGYETQPLPVAHALPEILNGNPVFF